MALEDCVIPLLWCTMVVHVVHCTSQCEVDVPEPWPTPYLFVPRDSTVHMNCTHRDESSSSWAINLPNDPFQYRSGDREFNNNGFYELPPVAMPRLLINDTSRNNGTKVLCIGTFVTTLIIFEPTPLELKTSEVGISGINVSWTSSGQSSTAELNYSLTISYGSTSHLLLLNHDQSHHIFKAPPGSLPCQIYNFSVTATPVGATYTGDGCSVPSPVLTMMLPSLPDVTILESTVNYSLRYESDSTDGFVLTVHFKPSDFCESYPVTAYMLLVEGTTNFADLATSTNNTVISVNNIPANDVYTFHLVVYNSEGNVSTNKRTIYTTDVQMITVMPSEGDLNTLLVQCYFVNGSTAEGCMVVLVGELGNTTVNLTRDKPYGIVNMSQPIHCYTGVFGYDIESDGSVGTLAVPGVIANSSGEITCNLPPKQHVPSHGVLVGSVVSALLALIILLITACTTLFFRIKYKRVIAIDNGSPDADNDDTELDEVVPVYDAPLKQVVSIRTSGDGADHSNQYNGTTHTQESPDKADDVNKGATMYDELREETEHVYHVLECDRPPRGVKALLPADDILLPDDDAPPLPPPFIPDQESQALLPLPPVYQDIGCLTSRGTTINSMDT